MREWLVNKLMTPAIKDRMYRELWENGKRMGKMGYRQIGKTVNITWANSDKVVFNLPYEAVAPTPVSSEKKGRDE